MYKNNIIKNQNEETVTYNFLKIPDGWKSSLKITYLLEFDRSGLVATGKNSDTGLVEVIEIKDHPWFIGVQFHPEYKSTVSSPHPLFVSFLNAAKNNKKK